MKWRRNAVTTLPPNEVVGPAAIGRVFGAVKDGVFVVAVGRGQKGGRDRTGDRDLGDRRNRS